MLAIVPVKVMRRVVRPRPLAEFQARGAARLSVPLFSCSVTCSGLPPESLSLTVMALPLAEENTSAVFSLVLCGPGTVLTGVAVDVGDCDADRAWSPSAVRRRPCCPGRRC